MYVATPYEDCPVCGTRIECGEIDSRGEWCRCNYYCGICDHIFQKLVTFKTQSDEAESEEWEDLPGVPDYERDTTVRFMWNGWEERGRIWKRHVKGTTLHYHIDCPRVVRGTTFHYHIDCPSVVRGTPPSRDREFTENELNQRRPG